MKLSSLYLMGFKPYFASKLGPWQVPGAMCPPIPPILEAGAGCLPFASHFLGQKIKELLSFELEFVRAGARRASGFMESRAEVILPTTLWLGAV